MIPVRPLDYLFLVLAALGVGVLAATSAVPAPENMERRTLASGFLAFLAIGCPICNKVVLLLGICGALSYFEPIQPLLGVASAAARHGDRDAPSRPRALCMHRIQVV